MADVAYKPTSVYSESLATPASKNSFIKGLIEFGTRINKTVTIFNDSVGTTNSALYQVPNGKTFFLLSASINCSTYSTNTITTGLYASGDYICVLFFVNDATATYNTHIKDLIYSIPIKFSIQEILYGRLTTTHSTDDGYSTINIVGYQIDNTQLQNLI